MLTVRKEQKFLIIDDCRRLRKRKKARRVGFQRGVAMKRMILVCCLCLAPTSGYAEGGWVADKKTGCNIWNPEPKPNNAAFWSGKCKNGKADGNGELKWYDSQKIAFTFNGTMKDGKFHGEGTILHNNGYRYSGEWEDGKKSGKGEWITDTITYNGEWKNNVPHGNGTMTYPDGDKYSGNWSDGERHGKGTYHFKDGSSYRGLWQHGERIKIF